MKKIILSLLAISTMSVALQAQKEVKYEKLYYKDLKQENSDITISVNNAVSTEGETKFLLKIVNKTSDYIIYKPQESKIIIEGKEFLIIEKVKVIDPNDFRTVVINLKGVGYNKIKNYSFLVDGLYKVSADAKGITTPDFKLPASSNDFKTGGFSCSLNKLYKESDKTEAKFKCAYNGDKIGFVFPSKTAVKMPDGNEYANAKSKTDAIMLMKGEDDTFTLKWDRMEGGKTMDMQKAEMYIKWNAAFAEVSPEKMKSETINLEFDEATSNAQEIINNIIPLPITIGMMGDLFNYSNLLDEIPFQAWDDSFWWLLLIMKNILVVYYTQTGQLDRSVKATLAPLQKDSNIQIDYELITPKIPYPYPWSYMEFFDVFPETVHGIVCELNPITIDTSKNYDLVVIAYQPWFLSICVPINSFLQTNEAKKILKDKPVITILACRNMWLNGQEKMKANLLKLEAKLVGNITYVDKSANLISLITVLAFVLGGVKEKFLGIFPKYGVSDADLQNEAPKYGEIIRAHLLAINYETQQQELVDAGAVNIKSNLLLMEGRGKALFPLYANYISKKGPLGSKERRIRVRIFGIVLPTAILILSPIITIVSRLAPLLFPSKINKEIAYYSQNTLRKSK